MSTDALSACPTCPPAPLWDALELLGYDVIAWEETAAGAETVIVRGEAGRWAVLHSDDSTLAQRPADAAAALLWFPTAIAAADWLAPQVPAESMALGTLRVHGQGMN